MGPPRVSRRAVEMPETLEFPISEEPQYVDENGYEVAAEVFAQALEQASDSPPDPIGTVKNETMAEVLEGREDVEVVGVEDEDKEDEELIPDDGAEVREPLLSLADRCVVLVLL